MKISPPRYIVPIFFLLLALGLVGWSFSMRQTPQEETKDSQPKTANEEKPEIKAEDLVYTPLDNPGLDTSSWKTFRSQEYGLEFKYPANWEVRVRTSETDPVLISSDKKSSVGDVLITVAPKKREMGDGTGYEIYLTKKDESDKDVVTIIRGRSMTLESLLSSEEKYRIFSPIQVGNRRLLLYDRDENPDPAFENSGKLVSIEVVFLDPNSRYFVYLHGQSNGLNNESVKKTIHQTLFSLNFYEPNL